MQPVIERKEGEGAAQAAPSSSSRRAKFLLTAFLAFAALAFAGLGVWQVERLFWKLDLIARVEARVTAPPIAPPAAREWPALSADAYEYRHVTATGLFEPEHETLVQAVTERGPGFWVMTPLRLADGTTILVNRGFVPPERRDPASRAEGNRAGPATVTGLLRISEPGGGFLRANDAANGRWYSRDVEAIASARGLEKVAPFFIDADGTANPGGFPVGGLTVVTFRNSHLVYALTWFALAVMSLGGLYFVRRNRAG